MERSLPIFVSTASRADRRRLTRRLRRRRRPIGPGAILTVGLALVIATRVLGG
jgi:uncharacterized protein involved in exopolysaccharide biosynthesis